MQILVYLYLDAMLVALTTPHALLKSVKSRSAEKSLKHTMQRPVLCWLSLTTPRAVLKSMKHAVLKKARTQPNPTKSKSNPTQPNPWIVGWMRPCYGLLEAMVW